MYTEHYKTLIMDIEEDTNKWKDILCSELEKLRLLKCPSQMSKVIYRLNAILIKIPMALFTEIEQTVIKFVWTTKDQK